ncbi:hypothetical protein [Clostridium tetani]|uniref:hypothetical protein n=1 Tax=Clostridium tetani TaxID=1513 RepID=UPI002955627B|nr:hypothetical protein [Clostridium tetani]BDR65708.1 hypothetical protein K134307016_p10190 [Clostridium tetani]
MVKANKGLVRLILFSLFISLILRSIQIGLGTFDGYYIVDGNLKNNIEKYADNDITIKKEQDFKLGKAKYKLFLDLIHTDLIEDIKIKTIDGDNLSDNNINYE